MMHENTVIDLSRPDVIGGARCRHDMVAAWCSWCLGVSEKDVPTDGYIAGGWDMVADMGVRGATFRDGLIHSRRAA